MAKFAEVTTRFKGLLCGEPKAGKTGSLASLANAGFKLKILDVDNNLAILNAYLTDKGKENVDAVSIPAKDGKAWDLTQSLLRKWDDGSNPAEWGTDTILVIDSASFLADTNLEETRAGQDSKLKEKMGDKLSQDAYMALQVDFESMVARLSSKFKCHILLIAHLRMVEKWEGTGNERRCIDRQLLPYFPGQQLPRSVVRYMNNVWAIGVSPSGDRVIHTQPAMIKGTTTAVRWLCSSRPDLIAKEVAGLDLADLVKKSVS